MKLPILFLGAVFCVGAAFADDATTTVKITERKTCAEIKAEIANLSAIENPDEETTNNLKELQAMHRGSCVAKSAGRRTIARTLPLVNGTKAADSAATISDALSEYLANKKSNCEKLNSEITKMAAANDDSKSDALASMRGVYDMDCADKAESKTAASAEPEKTDAELAAEYDANLAAGLCGDGTAPNKFGCCAGETFKDLGNLVFACCPKGNGLCFPPIK